MKTSSPKRPNLLKIIEDNYNNKQKQLRSGGTPSSLRSQANMSNPYMDYMYDDQMYYHGGYISDRAKATQFGQYARGGGLLSRTVTCSNCGHSWKGVTGGLDPMTCHNCGGSIKMKQGGGYFPPYHSFTPPRMNYGGDPSIPYLDSGYEMLDMYETAGQVIPGVTDFRMPRVSTESTSNTFYNPALRKKVSTGTTGQAAVPFQKKRVVNKKQEEALIKAGQSPAAARYAVANQKFTGNQKEILDKNAQFEYRVTNNPNYDPNKSLRDQSGLADDNSLLTRINRGSRAVPSNNVVQNTAWDIMSTPGRGFNNLFLEGNHYKNQGWTAPLNMGLDVIGMAPGVGEVAVSGIRNAVGNRILGTVNNSMLRNAATRTVAHEVPAIKRMGHHLYEVGEEGAKHKAAHSGVHSMGHHEEQHSQTVGHSKPHMEYGGIYAYADGGNTKASIVDYLNAQGMASDRGSRKKLAEAMGIKGYTGSYDQNVEMVTRLNESRYNPSQQAEQNPYVVARTAPAEEPQSGFGSMPRMSQAAPAETVTTGRVFKKPTAKQIAARKTAMGQDSGFRPYSPEQLNQMYNFPGTLNFKTPNSKPATTAKQAAARKTKQANAEDQRNLESGMIVDKGTNTKYVIQNGKVVKSFPVLTGQARDVNYAPYSVDQLGKNPNLRGTPVGTYFSKPDANIYGEKGFRMNPIAAFGKPAPVAPPGLAQHVTFGKTEDPAEYRRRESLYNQSPAARATSYACVNCRKPNLDYLVNTFPQGDTTMVIDSRRAADANLLKNRFKKKADGGENDDYSGTYSAGVYYGEGGSFVPEFYSPEYGLPEMMYGMGMEYGGYSPMYAEGGQQDCPPGYAYDAEVEDCVKLPAESNHPNNVPSTNNVPPSDPALSAPPSGMPQSVVPKGGFNTGFGLQGNRYNLDYGFGVGADMKSNVRHNLNLNFPGAFRMGVNKGDLGITGNYVPGKSWTGNVTAGIPLSGVKGRADILKFTGGMGQQFNNAEANSAMNSNAEDFMKVNQKKNPVAYNAGVEYLGKMFGEKGPTVKLRASYDRQEYGGTTPQYRKDEEYDMSEEEIQDLIAQGYKIQYI